MQRSGWIQVLIAIPFEFKHSLGGSFAVMRCYPPCLPTKAHVKSVPNLKRNSYTIFHKGENTMPSAFPQFLPLTPGQSAHPSGSTMAVAIGTAPYPEVTGVPDPATVALLKEDYAGAGGEITAILQYVYQQGRLDDDPALANAILQIAIVEMMHLDMLGDAIVALGGKPSFDDGHFYWDASKVDYAQDLKGMLQANIAAEKNAIETYEKHSALTENESVKALLARIAQDEQLHLQFFTEQLEAQG